MRHRTHVAAPLALLALAAVLAAQPQDAPLEVVSLKDGVYMVKGGGGANAGIVIGAKEALIIDAKMSAESCRAMIAEAAKLTPNPVRYVVLTHSDGDHVNGLAGVPQGITIVAHAGARKEMAEAFKDPKMSALAPYLPSLVVTSDRTLPFGGVRINLRHFGPAHTSGDMVVFLPQQRIAFIGDLAFTGRDPLIHRQKGGTSFGLVRTLQRLLTLDADTFISGHSDPLKKDDLRALLASVEERQNKVRALVQQGKSLDEVRAAFGAAAPAGQSARRFPSLAEIIYLEVTGK